MDLVVAFHCFKYFTTSRCDDPGSPVGMFSIVVSTRDEPGPESIVKFFELLFAGCVFGRKINMSTGVKEIMTRS
jgi:hypothetical protein